MLWRLAQIAYGVIGIVGLLALQALALYVLWWTVMIAVSKVPMIGKRHRHDRWDELNEGPGRFLPPSEDVHSEEGATGRNGMARGGGYSEGSASPRERTSKAPPIR